MINILNLSALALATLHIGVALVSAHGFVTMPPSRQARCRLGEIPGCGDVQYEPQSVEAPKGSFLCNGDGARFPQLNDDALFESRFFTVPAGVDEIGFTWTLTAPHRTSTWDYIVITQDNDLLISYDSHGTIPPYVVEHLVPLGGLTGKQTILARWNIADTPNSYYACVDLFIGDPTEMAGETTMQLPLGVPLEMPGLGAQS